MSLDITTMGNLNIAEALITMTWIQFGLYTYTYIAHDDACHNDVQHLPNQNGISLDIMRF